MVRSGHPRVGALLAVAFHVFLRTGEFCSLRVVDVTFNESRSCATLTLQNTKGAQRRGGAAETVPVEDSFA
eukprot:1986687-Lingulodinium_polyedra.AAC.1